MHAIFGNILEIVSCNLCLVLIEHFTTINFSNWKVKSSVKPYCRLSICCFVTCNLFPSCKWAVCSVIGWKKFLIGQPNEQRLVNVDTTMAQNSSLLLGFQQGVILSYHIYVTLKVIHPMMLILMLITTLVTLNRINCICSNAEYQHWKLKKSKSA